MEATYIPPKNTQTSTPWNVLQPYASNLGFFCKKQKQKKKKWGSSDQRLHTPHFSSHDSTCIY